MYHAIKKEYDQKYIQKESYWSNKPHSLIVALRKHLPEGATILDLGCGEGQNALYLARHGFLVTAVDISQVGIKKMLSRNKNIEGITCDITEYIKNSKMFDAIICINILHFIKPKDLQCVLDHIKTKTNTGGYNAIATFIESSMSDKATLRAQKRYFLKEETLRDTYKEWIPITYIKKTEKRKLSVDKSEDQIQIRAIYRK